MHRFCMIVWMMVCSGTSECCHTRGLVTFYDHLWRLILRTKTPLLLSLYTCQVQYMDVSSSRSDEPTQLEVQLSPGLLQSTLPDLTGRRCPTSSLLRSTSHTTLLLLRYSWMRFMALAERVNNVSVWIESHGPANC